MEIANKYGQIQFLDKNNIEWFWVRFSQILLISWHVQQWVGESWVIAASILFCSNCFHFAWKVTAFWFCMAVLLSISQQTRVTDPMLVQCWSTVYDGCPALNQHWADVSWLLRSQWVSFVLLHGSLLILIDCWGQLDTYNSLWWPVVTSDDP